MKILIVTQYFPPEPFRVGDLAQGLKEQGHDVTVLTGFPNYPKGRLYEGYRIKLVQREDFNGVKVIRVPLFPDTSYSKWRRALNYLSYALSASILGPFLVGKPDRIIVFQLSPVTVGIPGVVLKWLTGAPIVFWIQDIWPDSLVETSLVKQGAVISTLERLVKFLYRHSDHIAVQSRGFIPKLLESAVPGDKIHYLPNWAEALYQVTPRDEGLRAQVGMSGNFTLLFAGNIGAAQGLDILLETASLLLTRRPDIQIMIVGDGAMLPRLLEEADARNLTNVVFTGRKPLEEMPRYFAAADALLVQLKDTPLFAMTIPSKLQSYLACGRPVVAALRGSGAEVVTEAGAGVVCEPQNPQALAEAITSLADLPAQERARMGVNARFYYDRNFARGLVIDKLEAILRA